MVSAHTETRTGCAQIEGGTLQGLRRALGEEVT
jgi:hypothetical protein